MGVPMASVSAMITLGRREHGASRPRWRQQERPSGELKADGHLMSANSLEHSGDGVADAELTAEMRRRAARSSKRPRTEAAWQSRPDGNLKTVFWPKPSATAARRQRQDQPSYRGSTTTRPSFPIDAIARSRTDHGLVPAGQTATGVVITVSLWMDGGAVSWTIDSPGLPMGEVEFDVQKPHGWLR